MTNAGAVRVICATIAFGLGMDLPSIGLVVHWDAAESFQDFVQQTGRGGRDGSPCLCITFYDRDAFERVIRFARKSTDARERDYRVCNMQQVTISSAGCCASLPVYACTVVVILWCYRCYLLSCMHYFCHRLTPVSSMSSSMWVTLQVARWYHGTNVCRHVFIEEHFSTNALNDDLDSPCGTKCNFCRKEVLIHTIIASINRNHCRCA
jgi:hypothetical protein